MARWAPALRIARRDLLRHRVRTALTLALVALPVAVGVAAADVSHNIRYGGERTAREVMGAADALVEVTPFARTRVSYDGELFTQPAAFTRTAGKRTVVRRPRTDVDLPALLPRGSRVSPLPTPRDVSLTSGGVAHVSFVDAADPLTVGLVPALSTGVAPHGPDQVAVDATAAKELGMLGRDGTLRTDAALHVVGGTSLPVVGVLAEDRDSDGLVVVASPASRLASGAPSRYLVDLSGPATHALVASLARRGVGMEPRDVLFHPQAWHVLDSSTALDATSVAVGALAVLFGLVEVVLIVGSAFAVGARRQVRDVGLLAASGGAPSDVRRVLLAQGLVLGVGASLVGSAVGQGLFLAGLPLYERLAHDTVWTRDVAWVAVVTVTALGAVTGLVAAVLPAWSIGRLTPVAALTGRFPVRDGESRAHRPAFVLAGLGLLALGVAGVWTAHEYAPLPASMPETEMFAHQPSPLPVALGGLGLLTLLAGLVWSAPYVVRRVAGLGRLLPLSGRFAFRDAARHRFRTAAAAVALTTTAAGAVLAGFVVQAVTVTTEAGVTSSLPPHSALVSVDDTVTAGGSGREDRLRATVADVLGPASSYASYRVTAGRGGASDLGLPDGEGYTPVVAVDEHTLGYLMGPATGPERTAALQRFRSGGLVTRDGSRVHDGSVTAIVTPPRRGARNRIVLPAVAVPRGPSSVDSLSSAWVTRATAQRLGFDTRLSALLMVARRPVTSEDLARLSVHGIDAYSPEAELASLRWVRLGVAAGVGVLTLLVVGIAVALSSSEGSADLATMTAVGAGPWRRRSLGAMHGLFLGLVGVLLGVALAVPSGLSLVQVDGLPGAQMPWPTVAAVLVGVPALGWLAGWLTTLTRVPLVRRAG